MYNEFGTDYPAAQSRHREMASEANDLRYQALDNFGNNNHWQGINNCKEYLEIIKSLPQISVESYCNIPCEMYSGDLVIYTASIFQILHLGYINCDERRVLESLICLQKLNHILTRYKLVKPEKAKKWLEYKVLLEEIRTMYFTLEDYLKENMPEYQKNHFLDENWEINEEIVLSKFPNVDRKNLSYLKNYNPLLFQKKLSDYIVVNDRSLTDNTPSPVPVLHVVAAILFPPLGVFLTVGLGIHFWISLVLTFVFTWIPGMIHAVWLVYNHDRS